MKLISQKDYKKLLANGKRQRQAQEQGKGLDFKPVVRLFTPDAQATWLLTEIDPEAPMIAFGLWGTLNWVTSLLKRLAQCADSWDCLLSAIFILWLTRHWGLIGEKPRRKGGLPPDL